MNDPILEAPLEELLRPATEPADAERMWRSQKLRRQAERRRRGKRRLAATAGVTLTLSAAAALWLLVLTPGAAPGPLHLAQGATLSGTLESASTPSTVRLDDGSRILLDRDSRAEIAANEAHRLVARLRRGGATFDVTPGGPRRWIIEAGDTRVEVIGTRFSVKRTQAGVEVRVERGVVEVHDPSLAQVARLTAGESLRVPAGRPTGDAPEAEATSARAGEGPTPSETNGEHARVSAAHRTRPAQAAAMSTDELMRRADVARRAGRFRDAAPLLARVVETDPGDARAAVAAFSLGRLRLDRLGAPGDAAESFAFVRTHLRAGALVEDATALEARARERSGARARARDLARLYLSRFPGGRHADAMRRLADAE